MGLYRRILSMHDHLIIRVYLIDPSSCRDLSLAHIPSCNCRGRDILWMIIFGFWLCAVRGWRHDSFSAELPCVVVHAAVSTFTFFKLSLYKRRANSLQSFLLVHMDRSLTASFILFFGFLEASLPSWSTILWFPFSLIPFFLMLSLLVFLPKTCRAILWRMLLWQHQELFHC
jgi:hypothetical protein